MPWPLLETQSALFSVSAYSRTLQMPVWAGDCLHKNFFCINDSMWMVFFMAILMNFILESVTVPMHRTRCRSGMSRISIRELLVSFFSWKRGVIELRQHLDAVLSLQLTHTLNNTQLATSYHKGLLPLIPGAGSQERQSGHVRGLRLRVTTVAVFP